MNMLSLARLGADLGMFPEEVMHTTDRLFIECQPGHIQYGAKKPIEPGERDIFRAALLRSAFENVPGPAFNTSNKDGSFESSP
jgi:protein arginine kinase